MPGPADYEVDVDKHGESKVAKFRSVTLGGVGLMKKSKRFQGSLSTSLLIQLKPQVLLPINQKKQQKAGQSAVALAILYALPSSTT